MAKASRERAEEYAVAYKYALEHTRAGRRHKGRAAAKVARSKGVSPQYVADVLVVARKMGLLGTTLVQEPAPASGGVPMYRWSRLPVTFEQLRDALTGTAYVRGTP